MLVVETMLHSFASDQSHRPVLIKPSIGFVNAITVWIKTKLFLFRVQQEGCHVHTGAACVHTDTVKNYSSCHSDNSFPTLFQSLCWTTLTQYFQYRTLPDI